MTCRGSAGAPRVAQNRACPYKLENKAASREIVAAAAAARGRDNFAQKGGDILLMREERRSGRLCTRGENRTSRTRDPL